MDSFQETEAVHSRKGFFTNPAKVEFPYIPVQWRPSAPLPKFLHGKSTFHKKTAGARLHAFPYLIPFSKAGPPAAAARSASLSPMTESAEKQA